MRWALWRTVATEVAQGPKREEGESGLEVAKEHLSHEIECKYARSTTMAVVNSQLQGNRCKIRYGEAG